MLFARRGDICVRLPSNFTGQIRLPADVGLNALSPLLRAKALLSPIEHIVPLEAETIVNKRNGKEFKVDTAGFSNIKIGADGGKDICLVGAGIVYPIPLIRIALLGEDVPSRFWTGRSAAEGGCCVCS